MSSHRERLERLSNQTFAEFQAEVRAGERVCAEADLYWRTNRWTEDGREAWAELTKQVETMKPGEFNLIVVGSGGRSTFTSSLYRNELATRYRR